MKMRVHISPEHLLDIGVFGCTMVQGKHNLSDAMIQLAKMGLLNAALLQKNNLTSDNYQLSQRQQDCLRYLVEGYTSKAIANQLHLSPRTVEHYIKAIKKKMHCKSRLELIKKASNLPLN